MTREGDCEYSTVSFPGEPVNTLPGSRLWNVWFSTFAVDTTVPVIMPASFTRITSNAPAALIATVSPFGPVRSALTLNGPSYVRKSVFVATLRLLAALRSSWRSRS